MPGKKPPTLVPRKSVAAVETAGGIRSRIVQVVRRFVEEHFAEPIDSRVASRHAHVDQCYLCRRFKRESGLTPGEYIACVRLQKARELLADPTLRITEVALAAGFGSISQFNDVFKRHAGLSPTEYRKKLNRQAPGGRQRR